MNQRNKNILLCAGFFLSMIIGYQLAISKTMTLKEEVAQLKEDAKEIDRLSSLGLNLNAREKYVDSILAKNNIRTNSVQNNLLAFLNGRAEADQFTIVAFNEPHIVQSENHNVTSYQFELRGSYKSLEHVLYALEQQQSFGTITHVDFTKKRDYRKRKDYLELLVIVENVQ